MHKGRVGCILEEINEQKIHCFRMGMDTPKPDQGYDDNQNKQHAVKM